jgi:glucose dehydrogenase
MRLGRAIPAPRGHGPQKDRVFVTYRNFLCALDKGTGQPIRSFANQGQLDLRQGFDRPLDRASVSASTPPVVFEDLLILPRIRWQIPFGEFPDLAAKGLKNTGSDNHGGPVVTAGGLVFIGATNFDRRVSRLRRIDRRVAVGDDAAGGGQRDAVSVVDQRAEYVVIVYWRRKESRPIGQQHRRVRTAGEWLRG